MNTFEIISYLKMKGLKNIGFSSPLSDRDLVFGIKREQTYYFLEGISRKEIDAKL